MFFQPHITTNFNDFLIDDDEEFGGIGSFFKKIGKGLKKVGKVALKIAPSVAGMIPVVGGAISSGLEAAQGLTGGGGGSGGGIAKGLSGITNYGNQVLQGLEAIAQNPNAEGVALAEKLVASLSDPAQVQQAKKGKDAAALADFKQKAAAKLNEIKTLAGQIQQAGGGNSGGGLLANLLNGGGNSINAANGGGIDSGTLLLFGGGGLALIVVLILLTRK